MIVSQPDADPGWSRRRVMPALPGRADLGQLRRQARELLRAAAAGDTCRPEPDGTVHRNIHVALATTAQGDRRGPVMADRPPEIRAGRRTLPRRRQPNPVGADRDGPRRRPGRATTSPARPL